MNVLAQSFTAKVKSTNYLQFVFKTEPNNNAQFYRRAFLFFIFYILSWKLIIDWQGEQTFFPWGPKLFYISTLLVLTIASKHIKNFGKHCQGIIVILSISGIVYLNLLFNFNPFNYTLAVWYTITLSILPMSIFSKKNIIIYFSVFLIGLVISTHLMDQPMSTKLPFGLAVSLSVASTTFFGLLRIHLIERINAKKKRIKHFAKMNAHDIRGPIARIKGLINIAELEGKNNLIVDRIKECAEELDDICRQTQNVLDKY